MPFYMALRTVGALLFEGFDFIINYDIKYRMGRDGETEIY